MKNKRFITLSILSFALVCGGLSLHSFANGKGEKITTKQANPDIVAYAASYSSNYKSESQYSTQKTKTFDYLNMGNTLDYYRGDSIKVGIIDSGVNYDHEDFMVNSATKVKGASKYYEYGSSWVYYGATQHGYSYIDDTLGHGTNVAATVAAAVNSVGGLGLAPNVELYVYKVTNSKNKYQFGAIQLALQDAISLGLDVINMSFQSYEHQVTYNGDTMDASDGCSTVLSDWYGTNYLKNCYDAGITLVGAAGNYNTNEPSYPGSNDYVINVGSLNASGTDKAGFSNYGSTIDLVAPGYVHVADKGNNDSYKDTSGTSFSAPLVTAAIALYKQAHPSATPSQIESALYASCDPIDDSGSPYANWAGNGALNVAKFVGVDYPNEIVINNPEIENETLNLEVGDTFDLDWKVNGLGDYSDEVTIYNYDDSVLSVDDNGHITAIGPGEDIVYIESVSDSRIYTGITVEVVSSSATLSSITVKTAPTKTTYIEGNKFDPSGLVITATYSNNNQVDIPYSGNESSFSFLPSTNTSLTTGNSSVTITYEGKSTSQAIVVNTKSVTSLTIGNKKTEYYVGDSFSKPSTITANYDNGTSANVTNSATYSGYDLNTAGNQTVTVSFGGCSATYNITVTAIVVTSLSVSNQKTAYNVGDTFVKPTVTANYNHGSPTDVTNSATFTGYDLSTAGNQTVIVSYGGQSTSYSITVTVPLTYTLVTSNSDLDDGNKVIIRMANSDGVTGWNNNKDATVSSTEANWKQYVVGSATSTGFTLYDSTASKYIASPGGNEFKYNATAGTCSVDSSGHLICNTRYLCKNGTSYRFYTSIGSYVPFFVYKLPSASITNIAVKTAPNKTTYIAGEYFNPTGLVITVNYSDSTSKDVDYVTHQSDFTFAPNTSTTLTSSDTSVAITYKNTTVNQSIIVKTLSSISISGQTTSFVEGDTFTFGGAVTAHYSDTSSSNVTSSATFSGYDMSELGNQTVTVSYGDKTTTYGIQVSPGTLSSIAVSGQTTVYMKNYAFAFDGICTATFANGYQKVVTPTSVTSPDMTTAGNKTIIVSFTYNGETKTTSYNITVNGTRTVMESSIESVELTWSSNSNPTASPSDKGISGTISGNTYYESGDGAIRLGTGSGGGTITISSTTYTITSAKINTKYYSSYSSAVLKANGTSVGTLTNSYSDFTVAVNSKSLTIKTENNSNRVNVKKVTVYYQGPETNIGQSDDCQGLETFIDTYMHMDYVNNLGYCKDSTHHYYSTARDAFNELNLHQRTLFTSNSAYSSEWDRLSTWASFNGEELNTTTKLLGKVKYPQIIEIINEGANSSILVIVSCLSVSLLACAYIIFRKKKNY